MDTSHLDALTRHLSQERIRRSLATKPAEILLRDVWIAQLEKEIEGEMAFIGYEAEELTDDELFAALKDMEA
jgi:hypothetical protein